MAPIHDQMPVILPEGARDRWLERGTDTRALREILAPLGAGEMDAYPVSTLVNSPRNDSAACLRPA